MIKPLLFITITNLLAGCATITLNNDIHQLPEGEKKNHVTFDYNIPYLNYIYKPIDLSAHCPEGNWKSIEVTKSLVGSGITVFTLHLVNPTFAKIQCYKGSNTLSE